MPSCSRHRPAAPSRRHPNPRAHPWRTALNDSPSSDLIRTLLDDFAALQEAVAARMNGSGDPETVAALDHPALTGPVTSVLAYEETLALGELRCAELAVEPRDQRKRLKDRLTRVRRELKRATDRYKEQRATARAGRSRPVEPLELRVVRGAFRSAYDVCLRAELRARELPVNATGIPDGDLVAWAWQRETAGRELPPEARILLELDDDAFVEALLHDARVQENTHLAHDAVVLRWNRLARTAQAWGRYAVGQAVRDVLSRPPAARRHWLGALDAAYQDAAVLAARARDAQVLAAELLDRMQDFATTALADVVARCRAAALARFAADRPEAWAQVRDLVTRHQADCPERSGGCRTCHTALAAQLVSVPPDGTDTEEPDEDPVLLDRYAELTDLPDNAVVAVADAAVDDESAICGYGWAAEDGTAGHGSSSASSSGEAEIVAVCSAALELLERHREEPVVVLCDSAEAVAVVDKALRADAFETPRALLFPEGRELLGQLLAHRDRVGVRWMKGHVGHDMNETADALAKLARLRALGRVSAVAFHKREERILRAFRA